MIAAQLKTQQSSSGLIRTNVDHSRSSWTCWTVFIDPKVLKSRRNLIQEKTNSYIFEARRDVGPRRVKYSHNVAVRTPAQGIGKTYGVKGYEVLYFWIAQHKIDSPVWVVKPSHSAIKSDVANFYVQDVLWNVFFDHLYSAIGSLTNLHRRVVRKDRTESLNRGPRCWIICFHWGKVWKSWIHK